MTNGTGTSSNIEPEKAPVQEPIGKGTAEAAVTREQVEEALSPEQEAKKRSITVEQWQDLLHVAEATGKEKEWIDETFTFPGDGKIKVVGDLNLSNTPVERLPEKLEIGGILALGASLKTIGEGLCVRQHMIAKNCVSLETLPEMEVKDCLFISRNLQSQVREDAERLKQEGKIRQIVYY